jgi:hypothetical protein
MTRAIYENGDIITYEYDAAGNIIDVVAENLQEWAARRPRSPRVGAEPRGGNRTFSLVHDLAYRILDRLQEIIDVRVGVRGRARSPREIDSVESFNGNRAPCFSIAKSSILCSRSNSRSSTGYMSKTRSGRRVHLTIDLQHPRPLNRKLSGSRIVTVTQTGRKSV